MASGGEYTPLAAAEAEDEAELQRVHLEIARLERERGVVVPPLAGRAGQHNAPAEPAPAELQEMAAMAEHAATEQRVEAMRPQMGVDCDTVPESVVPPAAGGDLEESESAAVATAVATQAGTAASGASPAVAVFVHRPGADAAQVWKSGELMDANTQEMNWAGWRPDGKMLAIASKKGRCLCCAWTRQRHLAASWLH